MKAPPRSAKISVKWESVPNPDTYALLKAVAIVFRRRVPLSTGVDLTHSDDTLMCERQP